MPPSSGTRSWKRAAPLLDAGRRHLDVADAAHPQPAARLQPVERLRRRPRVEQGGERRAVWRRAAAIGPSGVDTRSSRRASISTSCASAAPLRDAGRAERQRRDRRAPARTRRILRVLEDQAVGGAGGREADGLDDVAGAHSSGGDRPHLERAGGVADVDTVAADQRRRCPSTRMRRPASSGEPKRSSRSIGDSSAGKGSAGAGAVDADVLAATARTVGRRSSVGGCWRWRRRPPAPSRRCRRGARAAGRRRPGPGRTGQAAGAHLEEQVSLRVGRHLPDDAADRDQLRVVGAGRAARRATASIAAGSGWRPRSCIASAISAGAKPPVSVTPCTSTLVADGDRQRLPWVFT